MSKSSTLPMTSRAPKYKKNVSAMPFRILQAIPFGLALVAQTAYPYKFLAYNPQFGRSHTNFISRLSDVLVDAGHEVVMLSPILDTHVGGAGTKKARVIELPQCQTATNREAWINSNGGIVASSWNSVHFVRQIVKMAEMVDGWVDQCNATHYTPGLIEALKAEKFDLGYAEIFDHCGWGIFELVGITKTVVTYSMSNIDGGFFFTQTPSFPSYVPSVMHSGPNGDVMSFTERFWNLVGWKCMDWYLETNSRKYEDVFQGFRRGFPTIQSLLSNVSLIFMNSEPLYDFPHPTTHRIIDIGGISVAGGHNALNETWSEILDRRKYTILVSFGTFFKSYLMPAEFKRTLRNTMMKFPDVTFIWKYEKPEDGVAGNASNIVVSTFAPQPDMLHDPRLTAFITHCGQGSTTEAIVAGVPLLVVPISGDQLRNAQAIRRAGSGIVLDKELLSSEGPLEEAVREILTNSKYRENARKLQKMLLDKPFAAKDIFVRNMEFVVKYGPLRQLDHHGAKLNVFQYYLIDVFAAVAFVTISAVIAVIFGLCQLYRALRTVVSMKRKLE